MTELFERFGIQAAHKQEGVKLPRYISYPPKSETRVGRPALRLRIKKTAETMLAVGHTNCSAENVKKKTLTKPPDTFYAFTESCAGQMPSATA